jgi:hypothetical protein
MRQIGIVHIYQLRRPVLSLLYLIEFVGLIFISYCLYSLFEYYSVSKFISIVLQALAFDFMVYLLYCREIVTDYLILLGEIIELTFCLPLGVQKHEICNVHSIRRVEIRRSYQPYCIKIIYPSTIPHINKIKYIKFNSIDDIDDGIYIFKKLATKASFHIT